MLNLKNYLVEGYRWATLPYRQLAMWSGRKHGTYPVILLFYHRIDDDVPNPWSMTNAEFTRQIDWLQAHFDLVSMEEAQWRIRSGNDRPTVHITFDDGYADNCLHAIPLLIKRKIPVTYFVTTFHTTHQKPFSHDVERGQPLPANTVESLRAMSDAGVEIGAHTRNHVNLGCMNDPQEIFDEVIAASREMECLIEKRIRYFAFPFGQPENLNPAVFQLLKSHGFEAACSAYGGYNETGNDAFHLQRIHGDPSFVRIKNWMTLDPRMRMTPRYEEGSPWEAPSQCSSADQRLPESKFISLRQEI